MVVVGQVVWLMSGRTVGTGKQREEDSVNNPIFYLGPLEALTRYPQQQEHSRLRMFLGNDMRSESTRPDARTNRSCNWSLRCCIVCLPLN